MTESPYDMSTLSPHSPNAKPIDALRERLPRKLRVFVGPEDGVWLAHAVDFDIVGQGDDADSAVESMFELLAGHLQTAVELDEVESLVPQAAPRAVIARLYAKSWVGGMSRAMHRHATRFRETVYDRSAVEQRLQLL
jgi:predicted RNase H-like HicB family nuclease